MPVEIGIVLALMAGLTTPIWAVAQADTMASAAPARLLRPFDLQSIAPALARPVGAAMASPSVSGRLELAAKRVFIAEYQLLFEVAGQIVAATRDGKLFGREQGAERVTLIYTSQPDIAALQALTDRAWDDLRARLDAAGVVLAPAGPIVASFGAVFDATEPASAAGAPVFVTARSASGARRYLVLAPTGMKLAARSPTGDLSSVNLAAQTAYPLRQVEGLSLSIAINLSAMDGGVPRPSGLGGDPSAVIAPLMEIGPAPSAALVHAHGQRGLVNLNEALLLDGEFGRLRPAPDTPGQAPPTPSPDLFGGLGRTLDGAGATAPPKRIDVVLETDGPVLARMALFGISAANQAIATALRTGQSSGAQTAAQGAALPASEASTR